MSYDLKDYLNAINFTKKNVMDSEDEQWKKKYPAFIVNKILSGFQDLLKRKKYTEEELRAQASASLVGWVCFDILKKASSGREDMREAMEVSLNQATYILERYLTALGVIASVSPLLGLLGTVIGMIDVFDTITDTESKNAALLAGGISTALITTASGLIVAIPSLVMHRMFVRRVEEFVSEIEQKGSKFIDFLDKAK